MQFYRDALKIAPGEPSVLTNMGLSLALAKQLPAAEQALRQAVASPRADARMRGDLALVLALEGRFDEAERVGLADLSPEAARANVETIRQMIAQNDPGANCASRPRLRNPRRRRKTRGKARASRRTKRLKRQRQPRAGATCFRIASSTWAQYATPSWLGMVRSSVSASATASSFLSCLNEAVWLGGV